MGLQDILPNAGIMDAAQLSELANSDSAYVGIVEESGSLFAMSPDRYPLVVFDAPNVDGITIDPGNFDWDLDGSRDLPPDVASVSRYAKLKKLQEACNNGSHDLRCLTGVRKLGSSSESRVSRLLDGAPTVLLPPYLDPNTPDTEHPNDSGNASITPPAEWLAQRGSPDGGVPLLGPITTTSFSAAFILAVFTVLVWLGLRRSSQPVQRSPVLGATMEPRALEDPPPLEATSLQESPHITNDPPAVSMDVLVPESSSKSDLASGAKKVLFASDIEQTNAPPDVVADVATDVAEDAVEGDETDKEADVQATPGKRKGFRRKRGKKKKGGVVADAGVDDDDAEKGKESGPAVNETAVNGNGHAEAMPNGIPNKIDIPNVSPGVVVPSAPTPPPSTSSLVVSDTVLGEFIDSSYCYETVLRSR